MDELGAGPGSTRHVEVLDGADIVNRLVNLLDGGHGRLLAHHIV